MELNEIYLGNGYELIKEIPDKSIDLVVTDPPYEIKGIHTGTGIFTKQGRTENYVKELLNSDLGK